MLTQNQQKLFDLLPKDGRRISSARLVELYYGWPQPPNAQPRVISYLKAIDAKLTRNDHALRLHKGKRTGPIPQEFWLAPK